jgi:PII-like signaling protein
MVIEIVDSAEKIDGFLPTLNEMITDGLVTLERVKVLQYKA